VKGAGLFFVVLEIKKKVTPVTLTGLLIVKVKTFTHLMIIKQGEFVVPVLSPGKICDFLRKMPAKFKHRKHQGWEHLKP